MKSNALQTVVDIRHSFNELLFSMTGEYDEIVLVFDTYCKDVSLKCATREVLLQCQRPFKYEIHDETGIEHITMFKRFLYHDKTKAVLADRWQCPDLHHRLAKADHHVVFRIHKK